MRGWKTWTGAGLIAAAAVARTLGYGEVALLVEQLGMALGMVGVAHKIEKAGNGHGGGGQ